MSRSIIIMVCVALLASATHAYITPMPFRPGYGLGSWIPNDVIKSMKAEGQARGKIILADSMLNDIDALRREIQIEANPMSVDPDQFVEPPMDEEQLKKWQEDMKKEATDMWNQKLESYKALFELQKQQSGKTKEEGGPSTFASNIESPVDWTTSKIDYMDRAFDSIAISSTFFRVDSSRETSDTKTTANKIKHTVEHKSKAFFGAKIASALGAGHSAQTTATASFSLHETEYTLLLTAFATHRKVRQITPLIVEPDLLLEAWNAYNPDHSIFNPAFDKSGFAEDYKKTAANLKKGPSRKVGGGKDDETAFINLVTDVYLGSSLVGMVHFVKMEDTHTSQSDSVSLKDVEAKIQFSTFLSQVTGTTEFSKSQAKKMASLASKAGLDVHFDLVCMGYIPSIKSQDVKMAVQSFAKFDPNTYQASKTINSAATAQASKESAVGAVIESTLRGLADTKPSSMKVMDVGTFMDAMDDYAKAAIDKEGVGVPVGLNVRRYTREDVLIALAKKYINPLPFLDDKKDKDDKDK